MVLSISLTAQNTDPLSTIAQDVVKKTTFTKGTGLFLLVGIAILMFILAYSKIPFIQEAVSLDKSELSAAFWVDIIFLFVFSGLYMLPEIIKRFLDLWK